MNRYDYAVLRAATLAKQKAFDDARKQYEVAAKLAPSELQRGKCELMAGDIYLEQGSVTEALKSYTDALETYERALNRATRPANLHKPGAAGGKKRAAAPEPPNIISPVSQGTNGLSDLSSAAHDTGDVDAADYLDYIEVINSIAFVWSRRAADYPPFTSARLNYFATAAEWYRHMVHECGSREHADERGQALRNIGDIKLKCGHFKAASDAYLRVVGMVDAGECRCIDRNAVHARAEVALEKERARVLARAKGRLLGLIKRRTLRNRKRHACEKLQRSGRGWLARERVGRERARAVPVDRRESGALEVTSMSSPRATQAGADDGDADRRAPAPHTGAAVASGDNGGGGGDNDPISATHTTTLRRTSTDELLAAHVPHRKSRRASSAWEDAVAATAAHEAAIASQRMLQKEDDGGALSATSAESLPDGDDDDKQGQDAFGVFGAQPQPPPPKENVCELAHEIVELKRQNAAAQGSLATMREQLAEATARAAAAEAAHGDGATAEELRERLAEQEALATAAWKRVEEVEAAEGRTRGDALADAMDALSERLLASEALLAASRDATAAAVTRAEKAEANAAALQTAIAQSPSVDQIRQSVREREALVARAEAAERELLALRAGTPAAAQDKDIQRLKLCVADHEALVAVGEARYAAAEARAQKAEDQVAQLLEEREARGARGAQRSPVWVDPTGDCRGTCTEATRLKNTVVHLQRELDRCRRSAGMALGQMVAEAGSRRVAHEREVHTMEQLKKELAAATARADDAAAELAALRANDAGGGGGGGGRCFTRTHHDGRNGSVNVAHGGSGGHMLEPTSPAGQAKGQAPARKGRRSIISPSSSTNELGPHVPSGAAAKEGGANANEPAGHSPRTLVGARPPNVPCAPARPGSPGNLATRRATMKMLTEV